MRPIDADALAAKYMEKPPDYYHTSQIVGEITAAPTVDNANFVEVVRCKDCIYRPIAVPRKRGRGFDYEFPKDNECPCQCDDDWYSWMPSDDWFCANGKRKVSSDG